MSGDVTIVFAPHFTNSFFDMLPVARMIKDLYDYQPHFTIDWVPCSTTIAACEKYEFDYTILGNAVHSIKDKTFREQNSNGPKWVLNIWKRYKNIPVISDVGALIWQVIFQAKMQGEAQKFLEQIRPSVVVTYRDDKPRVLTFITHIANQMGVPTILFPTLTLAVTQNVQLCWELRRTVSNLRWAQRLMCRFTTFLIPQILFKFKGEDVLFLPPEAALVAYLKGIFPENPWVRGGGITRITAVSTFDDYQALVEEGIPAETIILTGYPPLDKFVEQDIDVSKDVLCQKLSIPKDKFIVCYAAYPLLTGQENQLPISFAEMREHEQFIVHTFLNISSNVHVIFKLHPRSRLDEYDLLSSNKGRLKVIRDIDINDAIAGSDLLVTYKSSSIYTAMALEKPILTFSFKNDEPYKIVRRRASVIYQARNKQEFAIAAHQAFCECHQGRKVSKITNENDEDCNYCDGKSTQRFADVIHDLVEAPLGKPHVVMGES